MKLTGYLAGCLMAAAFTLAPLTARAAEAKDAKPKPYPLDVCVVSGEKFEMGEPFVFTYEGREVKLCCKSCKKDFDKDPKPFVAKIDEAAKKVKPDKLETCVVSGDKLGADPVVFIRKGQEVKLCCKDCLKEFNKNEAALLKKIEAAGK